MLSLHDKEINELRKVSVRFDSSTRTYYCFYHRRDSLLSELTLSYNLNDQKWIVDTTEYKNIFETKLNDLFNHEKIRFEEQIRHVTRLLDTYFDDKLQEQQKLFNNAHHHIYLLPWFRRLQKIRRWVSQDYLSETSAVFQRYSAPEESSYIDNKEQNLSVKALVEPFYTDEFNQTRTTTFTTAVGYPKESLRARPTDKAPPIVEIWLNVEIQEMDDFPTKIGSRTEVDKLKKLAGKFVIYFGGTFQCDVGHKYQLNYDFQTWHFTILKVELMKTQINQTTKIPKTKIIFHIDGTPYHVRG